MQFWRKLTKYLPNQRVCLLRRKRAPQKSSSCWASTPRKSSDKVNQILPFSSRNRRSIASSKNRLLRVWRVLLHVHQNILKLEASDKIQIVRVIYQQNINCLIKRKKNEYFRVGSQLSFESMKWQPTSITFEFVVSIWEVVETLLVTSSVLVYWSPTARNAWNRFLFVSLDRYFLGSAFLKKVKFPNLRMKWYYAIWFEKKSIYLHYCHKLANGSSIKDGWNPLRKNERNTKSWKKLSCNF